MCTKATLDVVLCEAVCTWLKKEDTATIPFLLAWVFKIYIFWILNFLDEVENLDDVDIDEVEVDTGNMRIDYQTFYSYSYKVGK